MKVLFRSIYLLFVLGFLGCKTDTHRSLSNTLIVGIKSDLVGLNPVNHSGGNVLRIMKHIMPSLVDFDPVSGAIIPVLIEKLPERKDDGEKVIYSFRFRKEAKWPNGTPVTVDDYIFSLKVAFNRKIRGNSWTRALSIIEDVVVDTTDKLVCHVVLKKNIANAVGYFAGFELLPAYHYDPNHLLSPFPLKDFLTVEAFDRLWTSHPEITEFAKAFSQEKYIRDPESVVGAGPYRLDKWESNERIVLVKRKNYWADSIKNITPILVGYPDTIIYKIVSDDVAISLLIKNQKLDVEKDLNAVEFLKLKENPAVAKNYDFYTPSSSTTYLVLLNTQSPKLDKVVRNALARCIDLNQIIDVVTSGLGIKVVSPLSPQSPYYNEHLKPITKNIEKAKELLDDAGWVDRNGDGFREKQINGQEVSLNLDIVIGPNMVGKLAGPILKSSAEKIGIKVSLVNVAGREMLSRVRAPKFEMAILGIAMAPTDYDPYGSWHSDNAGKKGKNYSRFVSSKMDEVINELRLASTENEKKKLYTEFQETLYDEQPVIYLFAPVNKIIVQNRWKPLISSVRPGFFENAFRLKKD